MPFPFGPKCADVFRNANRGEFSLSIARARGAQKLGRAAPEIEVLRQGHAGSICRKTARRSRSDLGQRLIQQRRVHSNRLPGALNFALSKHWTAGFAFSLADIFKRIVVFFFRTQPCARLRLQPLRRGAAADAWNFGLRATKSREPRQARKGATVPGSLRVPRSTRSSSHLKRF
jgi:hypothetical protein